MYFRVHFKYAEKIKVRVNLSSFDTFFDSLPNRVITAKREFSTIYWNS